MGFPLRPPRVTGDPQSDFAAVAEYLYAFYNSVVEEQFYSPVAGSDAITTVGTIEAGTWHGGVIEGAYGGTGVANAGKTITLGGDLATAGAFDLTLTLTGHSNITLPLTGTLATLAGVEELTNKTLTDAVGKGTWTASGTWTLPAFRLGGNVTSTGNPSLNLGTGTFTAGLINASNTVTTTAQVVAGLRHLEGLSSGGFHFTGFLAGEDLAANESVTFGFKYDTGTPANSFGYIAPFGRTEGDDFKILTDGTVAMGGEVHVGANLTLPKTSGYGIKVDPAAPTFGWRDLLGRISPKATGAGSPARAAYAGANIGQYAFVAGDVNDLEFHIPHDYAPGTDVFVHIHWSHNGTTITGNAVFDFYSSYSKGHNQANFPAEKNVSITYNTTDIATTPQYRHRIDEVQLSSNGGSATLLDSAALEPDGLVLMTFKLTTLPTISAGGKLFVHFIDLHYQTIGGGGTKQKAPDFYT